MSTFVYDFSEGNRDQRELLGGKGAGLAEMMETVLNVGLGDASVHGLADQTGDERFAWDSYRRLIQMFGKTVLGIPGERFEEHLDAAKLERGVSSDADLDAADLSRLVDAFKGVVQDATGS